MSEIPMDLGVDEDDSDFEDTKMDSNDEDEDMTMPDDAASEDEIKPDQQEALIDEQDLLTVLWQWVGLLFSFFTPFSLPPSQHPFSGLAPCTHIRLSLTPIHFFSMVSQTPIEG